MNSLNSSVTQIDLQNDDHLPAPTENDLYRWVECALQQTYVHLEQTIRIVGTVESRELNRVYRGKDAATNVLSFPADPHEHLPYEHLGDLVICSTVVEQEARLQGKSLQAHWAHMVVHGMLHLQGYDHQRDGDARVMEQLEIEILQTLGHTNPYLDH